MVAGHYLLFSGAVLLLQDAHLEAAGPEEWIVLFMVIERFKKGCVEAIRERFTARGRMLPAGVIYQASWIDPTGARCFQVMEADDEECLNAWIAHWEDLVEFEVVPVLTSSDFWAKIPPKL
jgi:hypothetical protein